MKYPTLKSELFILNRKKFSRLLKPNSIALFQSNDLMPRNGDCFFPFRQNSDLLYMCGIDQEETTLVLFPDCVKENFREVLFIKKTDEHIALWEGHKYSKSEARETSGVQNVVWVEDMDKVLNELILLSKKIYLNSNENDRYVSPVLNRDQRMGNEIIKRYPAHKIYRSQPLMKGLRMIKSQFEVDIMQQACNITASAFDKVMKFVKPGVMEYEIEAEIIREFTRQRGNGHAYTPIIASGGSACVLHYIENTKECKDGDVLLMDFGCEYANYASDLSRSIPVNGQFSKRQLAVYNSVLHVQKEATKLLVPGNNIQDYHKEVGKLMEAELLKLNLIDKTDVKNQDPNWPAYKKYFMHGTSHHMGFDVHDLANRYEPFQAGNCFTVEPGIYILEENLGIRIENDIVITDDIPFDLMSSIPREAEEIEEIMQSQMIS